MTSKLHKDVYCLFHETVNCICAKPITDEKTLVRRLRTLISVNEGYKLIELDSEKLLQADGRISEFQKRIDVVNGNI